MFNIGDLVVTTHEDSNPRLRKIIKFDGIYHLEHVYKNHAIASNFQIQLCRASTFRLATPEEIEVGFRK
ncbi:hypothetical protein [Acinetobacter phage vB_AbM_WUPSU]|nr:hypothetical protein [Acinetobacter phage vB_AbM_WUPSU]